MKDVIVMIFCEGSEKSEILNTFGEECDVSFDVQRFPGYLIEQNRTKIQSNSIEHQSFDRVR